MKTLWWVDHLGIKEAAHIWWRSLSSKQQVEEIRFLKKISIVARIFLILFFLSRIKITKAKFDLSMTSSNSGEIMFWKVWRFAPVFGWQTALKSGADWFSDSALDKVLDKDKLKLFFRRQIGYDQYRNLALIQIVNDHAVLATKAEHCLLLDGYLWQDFFKGHFKDVKFSFYFYQKTNYCLKAFARLLVFGIKFIQHFLCDIFLEQDIYRKINRPTPKIGVFYAQGLDLGKRSDLFWLLDSQINPEDVIVYFLDPHKPVTKEIKKQLKSLGVQYFSFSQGSRTREPNRYETYLRKHSFEYLKVSFKLFVDSFKQKSALKFWQLERVFWLLDRISMFQSFFESHNIKIHFGFMAEDDQNAMAMDMALERVQGVNVYAHWSNHPGSVVWPSHDVYFSWGSHYRKLYGGVGHGIKHLLYGGFPFDGTFNAVRSKATSYKESLQSKGVKFIICFFDGAYFEGGWFSQKNLIALYENLLNEVIADSSLGLILKPKRPASLEVAMQGNIPVLIAELKKQGRCLVMQEQMIASEASLAADLVIGYGVFNSAAFEAAISGIPTVLYDPGHQVSDALYKEGVGNFIFEDWSLMWQKIQAVKTNQNISGRFADFSSVLGQLDPYRDGMASKRIGGYLKKLYEGTESNKAKDAIIRSANEWYLKEFGEDKIVDLKNQSKDLLERVRI